MARSMGSLTAGDYIEQLKHGDTKAKRLAALSLRHSSSKMAVPALLETLNDPDVFGPAFLHYLIIERPWRQCLSLSNF